MISFGGTTKQAQKYLNQILKGFYFFNSLVQKLIFELCTGVVFIEKTFTIAAKNVCLFFVSSYWVFFQKFHFPFLHLKRAHKSLGDLYVDP